MKYSVVFMTVVILISMVGLVSAESLKVNSEVNINAENSRGDGNSRVNVSADSKTDANRENANKSDESRGIGAELSTEIRAKQTELREGNYSGPFGRLLNVRELNLELRELRDENVSIKTKLKFYLEKDDKNESHLRTNLSNGKNAEIKIMPKTASATALARLSLKVCTAENNCTIELKEVGSGNEAKVNYELKADQDVKILGLFKAKMHVESQIDAETGEVVSANQPWWAGIASKQE